MGRSSSKRQGLARHRAPKFLGAAAALALATWSLAACDTTVASASGTPSTEQTLAPEASPSPSSVENNAEREKLIKSLEIPANLSTQQLAETYIQRVNTWNNFGSKPNIGDIYIKQNEDEFNKTGVDNLQPIDFAHTYMEGYSDEFAEALYVDHNNKDIKALTDVSGGVLYAYMSTVNNQTNGAQEGYKTTATLDSATEDTTNKVEGQRTLVIDLTQSDNSDKMGSIKLNATGSGKWEETVVFKTVDGTDKIVSVDSRFIG